MTQHPHTITHICTHTHNPRTSHPARCKSSSFDKYTQISPLVLGLLFIASLNLVCMLHLPRYPYYTILHPLTTVIINTNHRHRRYRHCPHPYHDHHSYHHYHYNHRRSTTSLTLPLIRLVIITITIGRVRRNSTRIAFVHFERETSRPTSLPGADTPHSHHHREIHSGNSCDRHSYIKINEYIHSNTPHKHKRTPTLPTSFSGGCLMHRSTFLPSHCFPSESNERGSLPIAPKTQHQE